MQGDDQTEDRGVMSFLLRLRGAGISDRILKAVEETPHEMFVPVEHFEMAWQERSLPIACGQTMGPPDLTVQMVQALSLEKSQAVLEIGTGSGFQTGLLSALAKKVHTVDRYKTLLKAAAEKLERLGRTNVSFSQADGSDLQNKPGIGGQGLYDRIIAQLAYPETPRGLLPSLVANGVVITAIGEPLQEQMVVKLTKIGSRFEREDLFPARFGAFEQGVATST